MGAGPGLRLQTLWVKDLRLQTLWVQDLSVS